MKFMFHIQCIHIAWRQFCSVLLECLHFYNTDMKSGRAATHWLTMASAGPDWSCHELNPVLPRGRQGHNYNIHHLLHPGVCNHRKLGSGASAKAQTRHSIGHRCLNPQLKHQVKHGHLLQPSIKGQGWTLPAGLQNSSDFGAIWISKSGILSLYPADSFTVWEELPKKYWKRFDFCSPFHLQLVWFYPRDKRRLSCRCSEAHKGNDILVVLNPLFNTIHQTAHHFHPSQGFW